MKVFDVIAAMEPQPFAPHLLRAMHAAAGEDPELQAQQRVARALAVDEHQAQRFLELQRNGFLPGNRIREADPGRVTTLVDGFVQPVEDTLSGKSNGLPGIMEALGQMVETLRHGAGVACEFSRLRPAGAKVKGTARSAPGPLAWMRLFDRASETVCAGGDGAAHVGVLRVDHPDIERFLDAPRRAIAVTDAFMRAVIEDDAFHLVHLAEPGFAAPTRVCADGLRRHVYRTVRARALWHRILANAYCAGQPGIVYTDTLNRMNNLWYCETLEATGPGNAQGLPAYGCSCAGSHDLTRFVLEPFTAAARFDHEAFAAATAGAVELLDRVLDATAWPLAQQAAEAEAKRRIGLGFFGLAEATAMLGLRYGSPPSAAFAAEVAGTMREAAYRASVQLAIEHGPFPLFDAEACLRPGTCASTLPPDLQDLVRAHGIRNSHLLAIAVNGTRPASGDDASPGIAAAEQLAIASALAPFVDAALHANFLAPCNMPFAEFENLHVEAWRRGLGACSVSIQDRT